mgnify:CR=1 FL=1
MGSFAENAFKNNWIDAEIRRIIGEAFDLAKKILTENDSKLENVAKGLLLVETIDGDQFEKLYTEELTAEQLKAEVVTELAQKADADAKEAEESAKLQKEAEERLKAELAKFDENYLDDEEEEAVEEETLEEEKVVEETEDKETDTEDKDKE